MLLKVAWRNLNRNKRRSLIIVLSAAVGVFALFIYDAISRGMINQMLSNQIDVHLCDIQINRKGFNDDKILQSYLSNYIDIENIVLNQDFVNNYSKRIVSFCILNSAFNSVNVNLIGIEFDKEIKLTSISDFIIEGDYLSGAKNEILIGKKVAEKLEVGLGDKVVAVSANLDGSISTNLFNISGIFRSPSSEIDQMLVFTNSSSLQNLIGFGDNYHQIVIKTKNREKVMRYRDELIQRIDTSQYEVLAYQDIIPLLVTMLESSKSAMVIIYAIIGIGVLLGIINSMLMSVFERIQEFGVLMSIGMNNFKIFLMIVFEAFLLGSIGTFMGIILGWIVYIPLSIYGLDLSTFSEGLQMYSVGNVIYPEIDLGLILNALLVMPIASIIGAIYPSIKAIKLQPTEAMRYV